MPAATSAAARILAGHPADEARGRTWPRPLSLMRKRPSPSSSSRMRSPYSRSKALPSTRYGCPATIALVTAGFVFATGAFSSQEQLQYYIIAGAVTVAFWLFTLGHLRLI